MFGAEKIVVFDRVEERLDLAQRFGAEYLVNTSEDQYIAVALEITRGKGFDYVFETAGNNNTIKDTFSLTGNKASVCLVGIPLNEVNFSVKEWGNINRKEFFLTVYWMSYSSPFPGKEWLLTAHYFKTGALKIDDSFIFKMIPLRQNDNAFEMFKKSIMVKGKILIDSKI